MATVVATHKEEVKALEKFFGVAQSQISKYINVIHTVNHNETEVKALDKFFGVALGTINRYLEVFHTVEHHKEEVKAWLSTSG